LGSFFSKGASRDRTLPLKPGSAFFGEESCSLKTLSKGSVQGARSLNAPLQSAIRERVRGGGGGGGAPPQPWVHHNAHKIQKT
jgi:hypothetical protein